LRPTIQIDDVFTLMLTTVLCLVVGTTGSLALRALVLRASKQPPNEATIVQAIARFKPRSVTASREPKRVRAAR
jgi:hypothetical protein